MIVALRSVIACDQVIDRDDGGVDYLGVKAERLTARTRPGGVLLFFAIICDLDGTATAGRLEVRAPEFSHNFAFRTPAKTPSTALLIPLLIPIPAEGHLILRVVDEARGGKVFKCRFDLRFMDGAEDVSAEEGREFIDEANAHAEKLNANQGLATLQ